MNLDIYSRLLTKQEASALHKEGSMWDMVLDFLKSPLVKNILLMLSFGAGVSTKVTQAIKLLQEATEEAEKKKKQEDKKKKKGSYDIDIVSGWEEYMGDKYVHGDEVKEKELKMEKYHEEVKTYMEEK